MKKKERSKFPKDFFEKTRTIISNKETLKNIIPIKWSNDVLNGERKAIVKLSNK